MEGVYQECVGASWKDALRLWETGGGEGAKRDGPSRCAAREPCGVAFRAAQKRWGSYSATAETTSLPSWMHSSSALPSG